MEVTFKVKGQVDDKELAALEKHLEKLEPMMRDLFSRWRKDADGASDAQRRVGDATEDSGRKAQQAEGMFGGLLGKLAKFGLATQGISAIQNAIGSVVRMASGWVDSASDVVESTNKVNAVFGDGAATVLAWGDRAADALGIAKGAALDAAGSFGAMFSAMGVIPENTQKMSTGVLQLAADLGSFFNVDPTEMLDKLRAGISGEIEPLKRLGIVIGEARLKQQALKEGFGDNLTVLDEATKAQLRYNAILEDATKTGAIGDFAKTQDEFANASRRVKAGLVELGATVGSRVLPALQPVVSLMADAMPAVIELAGQKIDELIARGSELWSSLEGRALVALNLLVAGFQGAAAGVQMLVGVGQSALSFVDQHRVAILALVGALGLYQLIVAAASIVTGTQTALMAISSGAAIGTGGAVGFLATAWGIYTAAGGGAAGITALLSAGFSFLMAPILTVTGAIWGAVTGLGGLAMGALSAGASMVGSLVGGAISATLSLAGLVGQAVLTGGAFLAGLVPALLTSGAAGVAAGAGFLTGTLPGLIAMIPAALAAGASFLAGVIPALITGAATALATGAAFLAGLIPALIGVAGAAAGMAVAAVTAFLGLLASGVAAAVGVLVAFAPVIIGLGIIGATVFLLWKNWATVWDLIQRGTAMATGFIGRLFGGFLSWLGGAWHKGMSFLLSIGGKAWELLSSGFAKLMGLIGDITSSALQWVMERWQGWKDSILGVASSVGQGLIDGFQKVFSKLGEIWDSALSALVNAFHSAFALLPDSFKSVIGDLGRNVSGGLVKIKGLISGGDVASSFKAGGAAAGEAFIEGWGGKGTQRGSQGGGPGGLMGRLMGMLGFDMGALGGGGLDVGSFGGLGAVQTIAGLGGTPAGGGSGGSKAKGFTSPDGLSGTDPDGSEWIIDDAGKKQYISGPKAEIQRRRDAAKEAAKASKSGGKGPADKEASAARTMADVAKDVSSAVQTGLSALADLADADLPNRDRWEPKLAMLQEFITEAIKRFDQIGRDTLQKLGGEATEQGDLLDTTVAHNVMGLTDILGGAFDMVDKAVGLAEGLRRARFPEPQAIDDLALFMERIRDKSIAVSETITPEESERLRRSAEGMSLWADLWAKVVTAGVGLGAGAEELRKAPEGLSVAEAVLDQIARIGGRFVDKLLTAIPDEDKRNEALALTGRVAGAFDVMVAMLDRLGSASENIGKVRQIPSGTAALVESFLNAVARISAKYTMGVRGAFESQGEAERTLELSNLVNSALSMAVDMFAKVGSAAGALRDVAQIPEGTPERIEAFLTEVARISASFVGGIQRALPDDVDRERMMALSSGVAGLFGTWLDIFPRIRDAVRAAAETEPLNRTDADRVLFNANLVWETVDRWATRWEAGMVAAEETVQRVRSRVDPFLALLKDTLAGFDVASKLKLGEVSPVDPAAVEQSMENAAVVMRSVEGWSQLWATFLEVRGLDIELVGQRIQQWTAQLKDALGISDAAAKFSIGDIEPIRQSSVDQALRNANIIGSRAIAAMERWETWLERTGQKAADVIERTKAYAEQIKNLLSITETAGKFSLADVKPVDPAQVRIALLNVDVIASQVDELIRGWLRLVGQPSQERLQQIIAEAKAFADVAGAAVDIVSKGAKVLSDGARAVVAADVDLALSNAILVAQRVQVKAEEWAQRTREARGDLAAVVTENEQFNKIAGGAVELVAKTNEVLRSLAESPPPSNIESAITRVKNHIVFVVQELAGAFDSIEAKEGTLGKTEKLSKVLGPAAEALAKTLDALSLDKLLKNPLVSTRLQSGPMTKITEKRLDALGQQIAAGVRRTAQALIDGLTGIVVPDGLGDGFDRIISLYERIVGLFERLKDVQLPGMDFLKELAAQAAALLELAGGLPSVGAPGAGGGSGAPGGPGGGDSGGGPGDPFGPGGGGAPPSLPPMQLNLTIQEDRPINLDKKTIGRAIREVIYEKNLQVQVGVAGGGA